MSAEPLSPEQRAEAVCERLNLPTGPGGMARLLIASAVRAAETAAVEAERARCAKEADEMAEAAKLEFGALSGQAVGASAVALHLRANIPATEATHDR